MDLPPRQRTPPPRRPLFQVELLVSSLPSKRMNYYLIKFIIPCLGILFALWISLALSNNNFFEIIIASVLISLVAGIASALHNAKLIRIVLTILVIGYFISGKGFAYIGIPPLYIGEIILSWCGFCWLLRLSLRKIDKPFPSSLIFYVLSAIVISGTIQLLFVIEDYGFLALRDYAMIGYIGYFIVSYDVFKLEKHREKFYKITFSAGLIAIMIQFITAFLTVDWTVIVPFTINGRPVFMPHSDTLVPVLATITSFMASGIISSGLSFIGVLCAIGLVLFSLASLKSAFFLGIVATMGIYLFVKNLYIKLFQFTTGILIILALTIITIVTLGGNSSKVLEDRLESEFKSLLPREILTTGNVRTGSTAEWRYIWWRKITENTLATNPFFGGGLGSDISTAFLKDYYTLAVVEDDGTISRYPHNILFTALGRLGLVGFVVWGSLIICIVLYAFRFARSMPLQKRPLAGFYAWSFILAAVANGLVQATFEAPYAAIPFWIFFGCAIREYEEILKKKAQT